MILAVGIVIFGHARTGAFAALERIILGVVLRLNAAVVTHLDHLGRVTGGEHAVFARELFEDTVDGGLYSEQRPTFDARGGFLFVEDLLRHCLGRRVHLWYEFDSILWADIGT